MNPVSSQTFEAAFNEASGDEPDSDQVRLQQLRALIADPDFASCSASSLQRSWDHIDGRACDAQRPGPSGREAAHPAPYDQAFAQLIAQVRLLEQQFDQGDEGSKQQAKFAGPKLSVQLLRDLAYCKSPRIGDFVRSLVSKTALDELCARDVRAYQSLLETYVCGFGSKAATHLKQIGHPTSCEGLVFVKLGDWPVEPGFRREALLSACSSLEMLMELDLVQDVTKTHIDLSTVHQSLGVNSSQVYALLRFAEFSAMQFKDSVCSVVKALLLAYASDAAQEEDADVLLSIQVPGLEGSRLALVNPHQQQCYFLEEQGLDPDVLALACPQLSITLEQPGVENLAWYFSSDAMDDASDWLGNDPKHPDPGACPLAACRLAAFFDLRYDWQELANAFDPVVLKQDQEAQRALAIRAEEHPLLGFVALANRKFMNINFESGLLTLADTASLCGWELNVRQGCLQLSFLRRIKLPWAALRSLTTRTGTTLYPWQGASFIESYGKVALEYFIREADQNCAYRLFVNSYVEGEENALYYSIALAGCDGLDALFQRAGGDGCIEAVITSCSQSKNVQIPWLHLPVLFGPSGLTWILRTFDTDARRAAYSALVEEYREHTGAFVNLAALGLNRQEMQRARALLEGDCLADFDAGCQGLHWFRLADTEVGLSAGALDELPYLQHPSLAAIPMTERLKQIANVLDVLESSIWCDLARRVLGMEPEHWMRGRLDDENAYFRTRIDLKRLPALNPDLDNVAISCNMLDELPDRLCPHLARYLLSLLFHHFAPLPIGDWISDAILACDAHYDAELRGGPDELLALHADGWLFQYSGLQAVLLAKPPGPCKRRPSAALIQRLNLDVVAP